MGIYNRKNSPKGRENKRIRESKTKKALSEGIVENLLKWFGYAFRMAEEGSLNRP